MDTNDIKQILSKKFNFDPKGISKLMVFHDKIIEFNKKYNIIAKSTEKNIWLRHILDSAQIIDFIKFNDDESLADLGSGAGFPGLVLAIYNKNKRFHVKLYEKSSVKCKFLNNIVKILDLNVHIYSDSFTKHKIDANYITVRAFKKLDEIMRISREIINKSHRLIVLKGENAQSEINNLSHRIQGEYKLVKSLTNEKSKILIADIKKK